MDFCINQSNTPLGKTKTCNHFNRSFNKGVKVIGVGGAGINIVNTMIDSGIRNVDFAVVDTDVQKLNISNASQKTAIGQNITGGLSAGGIPYTGEQAAESDNNAIRELITGAGIVVIVAGMSGGTGTGAAPVIAKIARENDSLVVTAVTMPFGFEGSARMRIANEGIEKLRENVDSLVIIQNEYIKIANEERTLNFVQSLGFANNIPCQIVQILSELVNTPRRKGILNQYIRNSGDTFFAVGIGTGENRVKNAVQNAVSNVMLKPNGVAGASRILIGIKLRGSLSVKERKKIIKIVKMYAGSKVPVCSIVYDSGNMDNSLSVSVFATGYSK